MKKYVVFVLGVLLGNAAFWYVGGPVWLSDQLQPAAHEVTTDPVLRDVFTFTLQEEVRKKAGQPIEGYEPFMFLEVFPGLAETDFEGVEASIGYYTIEQGRLVHKLDETQLIHSAAKTISPNGMETLLQNVAARTQIDLKASGTITDIISVLTDAS